MARFTPHAAREALHSIGIPRDVDFHALHSAHVDAILELAKSFKYRKPRNANGSTARYFHAYLTRTAQKEEA